MKMGKIRQMIACMGMVLVCSIKFLECYPLVPAFFTALYMEEIKIGWLLMASYVGMMLFMPLTVMGKYGVILLVIAFGIRFIQWATDGCKAYVAGMLGALITMIVSFCGSLLEWRNQSIWQEILLEGLFVLGAVVLLNRGVHAIFSWKKPSPHRHLPEEKGDDAKLLGYAQTFEGLSKIFQHMSRNKSDFREKEYKRFQNELTGRICIDCEACALCWDSGNTSMYEMLTRFVSKIVEEGELSEKEQEELKTHCIKSKDMLAEAMRVFEKTALNRAWYNRLMENRQTIAEGLDAMAYVMQNCAKEERLLDTKARGKLNTIAYHAKEYGIVMERMHLYEMTDGHLKFAATMRSKQGGCVSLKPFLSMLGQVLEKEMRGVMDSRIFISKEPLEYIFLEDTKYRCVQGIARRKKDGAIISGDNFSTFQMENGSFLLGLSDGMGSGSAACKESELVLDLIERFLEAGFSMETSIRMMNAAMVLKGEEDLYSTVDLCHINLYSGLANFYKIGAAASFVKSGTKVTYFASHSLPVGSIQNPEMDQMEIALKNGDYIVMVTDGVLEYLHVPKPEETIKEMLEGLDCRHPGVLAKKMMERILLFTGGAVPDDMTILTACVWEK